MALRKGRNLGYGASNGKMIRNQLKSIMRAAQELHDVVMDSDELPTWVLTKVATSMDRLITANQYIMSKLDNKEVDPDFCIHDAIRQAKDCKVIVTLMR